MEVEPGKLPPPPGLIASLTAGFEAVANHIAVITLPLLLDLFLWFGPRLRIQNFLEGWFALSLSNPLLQAPSLPDLAAQQQGVSAFAERFNLLMILRTYPVGASSLLGGFDSPLETPLGTPLAFDVGTVLDIFGWGLALALLGLWLGALYFYWVSGVALQMKRTGGLGTILQTSSRAVVQSLFWWLVALVVGLPLFTALALLQTLNPFLGQIAILGLSFFAIWIILPVFFSPHGIYTYQQTTFGAIMTSLRMVRFTLPTSALFIILAFLISKGLDILWRTPPENTWLLLVGIVGHAFISTAVLASSFIYYSNVNAWLKAVFEQLKTRKVSSAGI
ncbi:MAG: hypothetical protein JXB85_01515 [Anaerolineales bacterium]|nr:hypothetical protein [Anaerolineales bacterium]